MDNPHVDAVYELRRALGKDAVCAANDEIAWLSRDESWLSPVLQRQFEQRVLEQGTGFGVQAVVRPASEQDVVKIATIAARRRIPLMLRGAGTSNFGLIAPDGGLIVDLRGLVGDPQVRDGAVSAPAGTLQRDMEKAARASGFEMPVLTTTYAGARSPDFSASMLYGSDWQTADALNYLNFLGATAFAWEFLRREPTYQADYQSMVSAGATTEEMSERVAHRGLECAVAPNLRADCAPVAWQPDLNPTTVVVAPAPDIFAKARSISELTPAFSCCSADGEH